MKNFTKILIITFAFLSYSFPFETKAQCTPPSVNSYTCHTTFCENTSYCPNQTTWFTADLSGTATGIKIYDNNLGTGTPVATFTGSASFYSGYIPIPPTSSSYYVFVLGAGGCQLSSSSIDYSFVINARPSSKPTSITASPSSVCHNDEVELTATAPPSGQEVRWSTVQICGMGSGLDAGAGNPATFQESNYTSFDVTKTMYGYYYDPNTTCRGEAVAVNYTVRKSSIECSNVTMGSYSLNINTSTTFDASSAAPSGSTYVWDFGINASPATSTSASGNVLWTSGGSKDISVTITDPNGCVSTCYKTVVVNVVCPTAVVIKPASNCTGVTGAFSAQNQGAGVSYSWTFTGGTPSSATGVGPHNVSWSTAGTKNIALTVSKSGCSNNTQNLTDTVGTNFSVPTISGPRAGFLNTSETFSTSAVSGASYTWTLGGGTQTGSGNSVGISWSTVGNKIFGVEVNGSGCIKSDTHQIIIGASPCYASQSDFSGKNIGSGYAMNNTTITDAANTQATFSCNYLSTFALQSSTLNFPRGATNDTCIRWAKLCRQSWDSAMATFNVPVRDLSFNIRDLDKNGGTYIDSVMVFMYDANGRKYSLGDIGYTANAGVGLKGSVFYSITSQEAYNTNGCDVTFTAPSEVYISKVAIYRRNSVLNAAYQMDMGISEFTWCATTPLPVEFTNESATVIAKGTVQIDWSTAMEKNNDYFTIERAANNGEFVPLANLNGKGNSNSLSKYRFIDYTAPIGHVIYRIKQTDYDGNFDYSRLMAVQIDATGNKTIIYPNPAQNDVSINSDAMFLFGGKVKLLGLDGRVYLDFDVLPGNEVFSFKTSELSNGIYLIVTEVNGAINVSKLAIKK